MRGGHEGPDVLHLHGGRPLEDEGGPRAHVRVPQDGEIRARVVLGGAGEDSGCGGRGEQFGQQGEGGEVGPLAHVRLCEQGNHGSDGRAGRRM